MKNTFYALSLAALTIASGSLFAQEAAPAEAAVESGAEPAAVAIPTIEELTSFIPDVVAMSGEDVLVTKQQILNVLAPQLEYALNPENAGKIPVSADILKPYVYQLANQMATMTLFKEAAVKAQIEVPAEEIDAQLNQIKEQLGEEKFKQAMAQSNLTEDALREKINESLMMERFQASLLPADLGVSDEEVAEFYEKNRQEFEVPAMMSASHILIAFPSDNPSDEEKAQALAKIKEIKEQLDNGADFAELAKAESACPSKEQGGDLGQFQAGMMVPEFEKALSTMKEGEISEPVETMFGYHLIKAGASTVAKTKTLDEVKDQIKAYLLQMKQGQCLDKVIEKIVADANMVIKLEMPEEFKAASPVEAEEAE